MADFRNYQTRVTSGAQAGAVIDEGLRAYMLKVYNLMAIGLAITGIVAFFASQAAISGGQLTAFGQAIYASPLKWVVMLAPLGLVFFLSFRIHTMSVAAAQMTFWVYAALMGLSLSSIFLIYTGAMFPEWRGSVFLGGLSSEALLRVTLSGASAAKADQWPMQARIRDVAQAPDGAIWLVEDQRDTSQGRLIRVTPAR